MKISIVGLNHKRTPVEIREKLAIAEKDLGRALGTLAAPVERVVLSTCNRVELSFASDQDFDPIGLASSFLSAYHGVDPAAFHPHLYAHDGAQAVRHLFRVASGLDSMVVGETQILGQVKRAYLTAHEAGHTAKALNKLYQHAFYVAKAVHSETSLASCQVSVSSVAASLAEKIFQDLSQRCTLVVGAGETGKFTLEAFQQRGVQRFLVANRTVERAERAARDLQAKVVPLDSIGEVLAQADIVISCVSREGYTLGPDLLGRALAARRQPLLIIDISVPRSVDPAAGRLEDLFLYNVDDLETIATDNMARRESEVLRSEAIIERETEKFMTRLNFVKSEEVIRALRARYEALAEEELKALPEAERKKIEPAIRRLINKLLHQPVSALQNGEDSPISADIVRRIFGLK